MSTVTVNVTATDIRRGRRQSAIACPVARAMRRRKAFPFAVVSDNEVAWGVPPILRSVPLPPKVNQFVLDFDDGAPVEPFTFDVEVPNV